MPNNTSASLIVSLASSLDPPRVSVWDDRRAISPSGATTDLGEVSPSRRRRSSRRGLETPAYSSFHQHRGRHQRRVACAGSCEDPRGITSASVHRERAPSPVCEAWELRTGSPGRTGGDHRLRDGPGVHRRGGRRAVAQITGSHPVEAIPCRSRPPGWRSSRLRSHGPERPNQRARLFLPALDRPGCSLLPSDPPRVRSTSRSDDGRRGTNVRGHVGRVEL